jgi:acyl carrier protein
METIAAKVHEIVNRYSPPHHVNYASDGIALGSGGLGLDSVAVVEILLACEEHFKVSLADELLGAADLTVSALIDQVEKAVNRRNGP